jgi:hypothetical protein
MLKKLSVAIVAVVLIGILPVLAFAGSPAAAAPAPAPATAAPAPPEHHPHIRAAIHELQEARNDLEHADHDFGGHRKEAMEAIDVAIRQLKQALEYDKK